MTDNVNPFLRISDDLCLICCEPLGNDSSVITKAGWNSIKNHARAWNDIPLKPGETFFEFTQVHAKVDGKEQPFGKRHKSFKCKGNFSKESVRNELKEKLLRENEDGNEPQLDEILNSLRRTRSMTGNTTQFAKICFFCNYVRPCDSNKYREGGLGVCEFDSAASKLKSALKAIPNDHRFSDARDRLKILTSGESMDIFSAEIRYHQSCYSQFVHTRPRAQEEEELAQKNVHNNVCDEFLSKIELNIIYRKKSVSFE